MKDKDTMQHYSTALAGNLERCRALVSRGSDMEIRGYRGTMNEWTAVMEAAIRGHLETEKCLTKAGADINTRDIDGRTAVMGAAYRGGHLL